MPIMYVESVVDGMLKGLNQQVSSLKYMLLDSSSRIVLILFLVPSRGMEGFLFIMVLSNLLTCFLNTHRLLSVTGMKLKWSTWILKPVLAMCTGRRLGSPADQSHAPAHPAEDLDPHHRRRAGRWPLLPAAPPAGLHHPGRFAAASSLPSAGASRSTGGTGRSAYRLVTGSGASYRTTTARPPKL